MPVVINEGKVVFYKNYVISGRDPNRVVYHPDYEEPVYRAGSTKEAKRFIDAYRAGTIWAVTAFRRKDTNDRPPPLPT